MELMGVISVFEAVIVQRFAWMMRINLVIFYCFPYLFFILDAYNKENVYVPLSIAVLVLCLINILIFVSYPYFVTCFALWCSGVTGIGPKVSDSINAKSNSNSFELRMTGCCITAKRKYCIYEGPIKDGRPHGMGTWSDNSYRGEHLVGYWEQGVPIGPFESRENDTRNAFMNLRVFFCTNTDAAAYYRKRPCYGVASVECCVTGDFYKGFPGVNYLQDPTECTCEKNKCTCMDSLLKNYYLHIDHIKKQNSVLVSVDERNDCLVVSDHKTKKHTSKNAYRYNGKRNRNKIKYTFT